MSQHTVGLFHGKKLFSGAYKQKSIKHPAVASVTTKKCLYFQHQRFFFFLRQSLRIKNCWSNPVPDKEPLILHLKN